MFKPKEKFLKLETHCHSFGGSHCAKASNDELIRDYVRVGYNGIVITNHVSEDSYRFQKGETHAEKVRFYFSLIEKLSEELSHYNIKVFWGAEVRILGENGGDSHQEFTLYGISEKDMTDNKPLFTFTQEELFRFAEKKGLFMYQTHPFRDGIICGNPRFLHGAEAFNGHFHHRNNNDLAEDFCLKNKLIAMSGSDYHHGNQPITGGIFVSENICDNEQLIECIFKNNFKIFKKETLYERELKKYKEQKQMKSI